MPSGDGCRRMRKPKLSEGDEPTRDRAVRGKRGPRLGQRVTMTDIAKAAGCSQAAVSFVLNETPGTRISQQTRDRVLDAARSLGYVGTSYTTGTTYSGSDN